MAIGALIGALFAMSAAASGWTLFGLAAGQMWMVGALVGAAMQSLIPSFNTPSMTYTLDPISNPMAQLVAVPVAYGKVRVSGNIFYQQFHDDSKQVVYEHVAFSEGPIKACNSADVMANDYTTAELSTITKEVFLGTANQAPSSWDPEGLAYPYLAYVALKMEASAKLSGNPTITAVIQGRDLALPGQEEGPTYVYIGADHTATSGGFELTDGDNMVRGENAGENLGYKNTDVECDCWGDDGGNSPDPAGLLITFYSDVYAGTTNPAVICVPLWLYLYKTSYIKVYPDSTLGTYYQFSMGEGWDEQKVLGESAWGHPPGWEPSGVRLGWEPRKILMAEWFDGKDHAQYASGVLTILIPADKIPTGGNAKIVCGISGFDHTTDIFPFAVGGLLPYTDAETDSPPSFFDPSVGYANPAWCIYDLLTNTRYGAGIPESWIDKDSFIAVAAQCDTESIALNYVVDTQKPIVDHLQEMLGVCRGWLSFRGLLRIGMDAPVLSYSKQLTSDDIIEGSFSYHESPLDQIPNRVILEYTDGADDGDGTWETVDKSIEDWDDIRKRGAFERRVSMKGITGKAQAKAMANYLWESTRRCTVGFSCRTGLQNSDVEVGDVVAVTYDLPGWIEKWFRIVKVEDTEEGIVTISGVEYDAMVFDTSDDV